MDQIVLIKGMAFGIILLGILLTKHFFQMEFILLLFMQMKQLQMKFILAQMKIIQKA